MSAAAVLLVAAGLAMPAAHGEPPKPSAGGTFGWVDGPWSASVTHQYFSPSEAGTHSENNSTAMLGLDDTDSTRVELYAGGGSFSFAAPEASGRQLRAGFYGGALTTNSVDPTRPQMSLDGFEQACHVEGRASGSFDVRELHRTNGEIDRLWIIFEQHCMEYRGLAWFGEIRFGYPERRLAASPTLAVWPDQTFVGARGAVVDVSVRQTSASSVPIDRAAIVGPGRDHSRSSQTTAPDASLTTNACQVGIAFVPQVPGPHRARLRVKAGGEALMVPLEARAIPRETVLELDFEAAHPWGDEYPDTASHRTIRPDTAGFFGHGSPRSFDVLASNYRDIEYNLFVGIPDGGVGTVHEFGAPNDEAYLGIYPSDGQCSDAHGTVEVGHLDVGPDETLRRARVSFVHVCDDDPGANGRLVGDLKYRWAADVQPPDAVTDLELHYTHTGHVAGSWQPTVDADLAGEVVRWYPGLVRAPKRPTAGLHAQVTEAGRVLLPPRARAQPVTVSVFAVDETGNVSAPAVARLL